MRGSLANLLKLNCRVRLSRLQLRIYHLVTTGHEKTHLPSIAFVYSLLKIFIYLLFLKDRTKERSEGKGKKITYERFYLLPDSLIAHNN